MNYSSANNFALLPFFAVY